MPKDKEEVWYKKLSGILGIIVVIVGLVTTLFAIDNRYAKCEAVDQFKIDTTKTLQQVRQDMRQDRYIDRYDRLKDRKRDLEFQLKKNPNDKDIKNEIEEVKKELVIVRQQIIEMEKLQTQQNFKIKQQSTPVKK